MRPPRGGLIDSSPDERDERGVQLLMLGAAVTLATVRRAV
jgi:hypothetical protein